MIRWPHAPFPQQIDLPGLGHLPPFTHLFDSDSVWAVRAALGACRPLLVRGDPGTGKSQLARAVAHALRRPLVSQVIGGRSEPSDLHYRFDAVARLAQAQLLGARAGAAASPASASLDALDETLFLHPGPLWWVFDWNDARGQHGRASTKGVRPEPPPEEWGWQPEQGTVLLIDEIDKADSDLPNGLLESLGNGEFHVPQRSQPVRAPRDQAAPLVIITTNEERELPAAFLRRCLVLELALPDGEPLLAFLEERGRAHFGERCSREVYREAARQLGGDRERARSEDLPAPGQAEYLDLLRAVCELVEAEERPAGATGAAPWTPAQRAARQLEVLRSIQGFALRKGRSQRR